ncbi:D-beta-hydroxybutyrate dehydrogenase-like isoform X1 [Branchiostoma lanceolatum]|uniref:D-beta-hydroxybutyrate dehydrogenase-like isoform X1 n=1 Tax=Branchiostoma lanceolatum TaxID=7740 RepID=UPI0034533EEB
MWTLTRVTTRVLTKMASLIRFAKTSSFVRYTQTATGTAFARCLGTHPAPLKGRSALVTGSTSGIGLGIARALAESGCDVIYTGFADEKLLTDLQEDFRNYSGVKATYIPADLTMPTEVERLCTEAKEHCTDGVDIVVNNAGFQHTSPIESFPLATWDAMMAAMLTAPFLMIKHLLPAMKAKGWGRIINISSAHGLVASVEKCAYVSAKHGINGLTKVVALETAGTGVTCNAVCPGWVPTPLVEKQIRQLMEDHNIAWKDAQTMLLSRKQPSNGFVTPEQIGDMVTFLCSQAANQMTGSVLCIDGGWTAQ